MKIISTSAWQHMPAINIH